MRKRKSKRPTKRLRPATRKAKSRAASKRTSSSGAHRLKRRRGAGKQFEPGNPYRFPKGVSPNPGGRPKALGEAYRKWLEVVDEKSGLSFVELVAQTLGNQAIAGDIAAAREMRQATEGDKVTLMPQRNAEELSDDELAAIAGGSDTAASGD